MSERSRSGNRFEPGAYTVACARSSHAPRREALWRRGQSVSERATPTLGDSSEARSGRQTVVVRRAILRGRRALPLVAPAAAAAPPAAGALDRGRARQGLLPLPERRRGGRL